MGEYISIVVAMEEDCPNVKDNREPRSTQTQYLTFDSDGLKVSLDAFSKVFLSQLSNPNIKYFCYKVNGNIVGIANYRVDSRTKMSHRAKIGISVLADYQNKGIGKQLLASMIEYLEQQKQIELVELEVACENKAAIHLYEKFGFKKIGK
ncbi:GNAT family N-acetyltransferase, partial [Enterococcus cecorum]|uniref:GNAT family N-acetyltransferase n=1 Tax=Enterococcus cecorum TaxID=44008 RepID=UPI001FAB74C8|nr:GNAT family N-acetyltransferase [Enterococcus cecorum]